MFTLESKIETHFELKILINPPNNRKMLEKLIL